MESAWKVKNWNVENEEMLKGPEAGPAGLGDEL